MIDKSFEHDANKKSEICETGWLMFIEVMIVLSNAFDPIVVTLFGIVIELRYVHPEKAKSPIVVTVLGKSIVRSDVQESKA